MLIKHAYEVFQPRQMHFILGGVATVETPCYTLGRKDG